MFKFKACKSNFHMLLSFLDFRICILDLNGHHFFSNMKLWFKIHVQAGYFCFYFTFKNSYSNQTHFLFLGRIGIVLSLWKLIFVKNILWSSFRTSFWYFLILMTCRCFCLICNLWSRLFIFYSYFSICQLMKV